jgi:hydrogenase large subunit
MAIIKIDPLNRIEGHVKVEVEVDANGVVQNNNVKVAGTMFRGFENIMAKRDPRDVPVLIQRI